MESLNYEVEVREREKRELEASQQGSLTAKESHSKGVSPPQRSLAAKSRSKDVLHESFSFTT